MTPMLELATRAFEQLSAMRKAALQTKQPPQPINITGAPANESTIKGINTNIGEYQ